MSIIDELILVTQHLEKEKIQDALRTLKKVNIKSLFNYLAYTELDGDDDEIILNLVIRILQNIYNNFKEDCPLSDEQYDMLYEKNRMFEEVVGANINDASNKTISTHSYPELRGSLDKVHFMTRKQRARDLRKSLEDWYNSIKLQLKGKNDFVNLITKFDGLSVIFECHENLSVKVLTRGDVDKNEAVELDCFKNAMIDFSHVNDFGWNKFGVKTEIIMTYKDFEKFKEVYGEFKSPRSAVSSILNSKDFEPDMLKYLTIIPLQVQNFESKQIVIPYYLFDTYHIVATNLSNIMSDPDYWFTVMEQIRDTANELGIPCDGAVIRLMDENVQKELGRDGAINNFEVAYKFPPETKKTTLLAINFDMGILGGITPVAKIEPVKIKGNTIKSISLGSVDRFESLELRIGQEVIIKYDIIPYLIVDDTCLVDKIAPIVKTITHCEFCGTELKKDPILKCINTSCDSRIMGKIVNYLNKMRIVNISTATVKTLFTAGFLKDIGDLYTLYDKRDDLEKLPRLGKSSLNNIFKGIEARKKVYDYELLGSIGIVDVGQRMFKKIMNIYHIDELVKLSLERGVVKLTSIPGIGIKMATKIVEGVIDNERLIKFLCSQIEIQVDSTECLGKVCFTKVRDTEFQAFLLSKGIASADGFSKDLQAVIVPSKSTTSSKTEKAIKNNIPVLTLEEAHIKFGYR